MKYNCQQKCNVSLLDHATNIPNTFESNNNQKQQIELNRKNYFITWLSPTGETKW